MKTTLEDLTLVVPTYFRQHYAMRLMEYWVDKGPKVIVLDGTNKPINNNYLKRFGSSITYIHNPVGFYERLKGVLSLITTNYVALAGDDEFYIPSTVVKCIGELEKEPDLVACCGRAIGFSYESKTVKGRQEYPTLANYSIDGNNAEERLVQHMREYVLSLLYAVCRTDVWRKSFECTLRNEFPFFAACEIQFELLVSYAGKSKVIADLMWLRSIDETEPTRGTDPSLDPAKEIPDWWANSANSGEHEKFLAIMAEGFSMFSNQSQESNDYRKSVIKGVEAYLDFCEEHVNRSPAQLDRGFAGRLIPDRYKKTIKDVLYTSRIKKGFSNASLIDAAKSLEASGVHVDYDELRKIESIIREFHQNRTNQS